MNPHRKPWLIDPRRLPIGQGVRAAAQEAQQRALREMKKKLGPDYRYEIHTQTNPDGLIHGEVIAYPNETAPTAPQDAS